MKLLNLPNLFTLFRIALSPIFVLFYLYPTSFGISASALPYILLLLLTLCEVTDVSDGYIARRTNQVTEFGKLLDPMADSLYRISIFLAFTQEPIHLPLWVVLLFLYRDMGINALRSLSALKGHALAARTSGKLKAILQASAAYLVLFLLLLYSQGELSQAQLTAWSTWIVFPVALWAIFSGIEYLVACPLKSSP